MQRIYYSRQNYNQLKRKQYEEYIKRKNRYYLYRKKCYEEYLRRQRRYYLYKRKQYEEYFKRENRYYLNRKKHYEEYLRRKNRYYLYMNNNYEKYVEMLNKYNLNNRKYSEIDSSQSRYFNNFRVSNNKEKYINDNDIKSVCGYLGSNMEERKLGQYGYLKNKIYPGIETLNNEKYLEKNDNNLKEENVNNIIEGKDKEYIEANYNEFIEDTNGDFIVEGNNYLIEENNKKNLSERTEELLGANYANSIDEELSKNNIYIEELYVKFPVILAETSITISIEDTIRINQEVNVIKRIKKNVFLTESRLIPFSKSNTDSKSGILFIKGFIRNNIEYETQTDTTAEKVNVCGDIKYCIIEVPFNFTTRITFLGQPIFIENNTTSEVNFLTKGFQRFDAPTDSVIADDTCEQCFMFTEIFNDPPFVELVKATFIEVNINKSLILCKDSITQEKSTEIKEQIILNLILRVLQKQQIRVEKE